MSKKRAREYSTSPKFQRVTWTEKRTRRGAVLTAEAVTPSSQGTPTKPRRHAKLQRTGYSQDHSAGPGEAFQEAMSLPPIPAPEILAPKKGQRGKVWEWYILSHNKLIAMWIVPE